MPNMPRGGPCRGVEVEGRTFDRKVEGSSPDINFPGYHQQGHPDIKWLTALSKSPAMQAPPTSNTGENGRKIVKLEEPINTMSTE